MDPKFYEIVEGIIDVDPRYHGDAYEFVLRALTFAQKKYKRTHHITGDEYLEGIKGLLLKDFGPMTLTVLDFWGISSTADFGQIIQNLVKFSIVTRDSQDHYDSFRDAYDFTEVFEKGYRQQLNKRIRTMRT